MLTLIINIKEMLQDKLSESFHKTGDFFKISGVPREESFVVDRRPWTIFNFIFWVILILCPMAYYLLGLLFSGELLYFSIGAGILSICEYSKNYLLLNLLINLSYFSWYVVTQSYWNVEDK